VNMGEKQSEVSGQ